MVGEANMLKLDVPARHFVNRIDWIGQIALFIEHLTDTLRAGDTHAQHHKYHGHHHQAHQNIHAVCKQAHQLARGQRVLHDLFCAQPAD